MTIEFSQNGVGDLRTRVIKHSQNTENKVAEKLYSPTVNWGEK